MGCQAIVGAAEHRQLGDDLFGLGDSTQCAAHGAVGSGDDVGVSGVGFLLCARCRLGHVDAKISGNDDHYGANGLGMIDYA